MSKKLIFAAILAAFSGIVRAETDTLLFQGLNLKSLEINVDTAPVPNLPKKSPHQIAREAIEKWAASDKSRRYWFFLGLLSKKDWENYDRCDANAQNKVFNSRHSTYINIVFFPSRITGIMEERVRHDAYVNNEMPGTAYKISGYYENVYQTDDQKVITAVSKAAPCPDDVMGFIYLHYPFAERIPLHMGKEPGFKILRRADLRKMGGDSLGWSMDMLQFLNDFKNSPARPYRPAIRK